MNLGNRRSTDKNGNLPPLQERYRLTRAGTNVFRARNLQTRRTRQYCNRSRDGVYQPILETSLLSPKHQSQAVDRVSSTDCWPGRATKPDHGAVLTGLLQLPAGQLGRTVTFSRVCLQQFRPPLNANDAILGQLPLPPANAVEATESPIKYAVGNTGGSNGIGNGRDSPASPGEHVGSPGTAIQIRWLKGRDLRSREQSVALDPTLPND